MKTGQVLARIDDRIYTQKPGAGAGQRSTAQKAALANSRQQEAGRPGRYRLQPGADRQRQRCAEARAARLGSRQQARSTKGVSTASEFRSRRRQRSTRQRPPSIRRRQRSRFPGRTWRRSSSTARSLEAAVSGAEAAVQLAEIDLQNATITRLRDGRVGEVGVRVGQYVTPRYATLAVVPDDVWVDRQFQGNPARRHEGGPAGLDHGRCVFDTSA